MTDTSDAVPGERTRTRSAGERVRLAHALVRLRACVDALELDVSAGGAPGTESARALVGAANEVAWGVIRIDSYMRAEGDAAQRPADSRHEREHAVTDLSDAEIIHAMNIADARHRDELEALLLTERGQRLVGPDASGDQPPKDPKESAK